MKMKTFAVTVALGLSAMAASAAHVWEDPSGWWDSHWTVSRGPAPKFHANEVTFDVFATYTAAERGIDDVFDTSIRDNENGMWGGGVGLNYFFTRELGIGADVNIPDNDGKFIDSVNASLIARLPWEAAGLAPYVFGGGGRMTEPEWEWTAHAGLGLEFRFNPLTGIFADGRYVWANGSRDNQFDGDHLLLRAGLRLAF
jgi:opacity protein-like surface antigen